MNKTSFLAIFTIATVLFTAQSFTVEARDCHRCNNRTNVHVGVGTHAYSRPGYVVQRYARPVPAPVVYATPVYAPPGYPVVYERVAPVYPVYVEEVYVAPRPSLFSGLSLSWNFFR